MSWEAIILKNDGKKEQIIIPMKIIFPKVESRDQRAASQTLTLGLQFNSHISREVMLIRDIISTEVGLKVATCAIRLTMCDVMEQEPPLTAESSEAITDSQSAQTDHSNNNSLSQLTSTSHPLSSFDTMRGYVLCSGLHVSWLVTLSSRTHTF